MSQVEEELEALLSIFTLEELTIYRGDFDGESGKWKGNGEKLDEKNLKEVDGNYLRLVWDIVPHTEMEDTKKIFVSARVAFCVSLLEYPNKIPMIEIEKSKGLDDLETQTFLAKLEKKAKEHLGEPMMFALVEEARELMTENNRILGDCCICFQTLEQEEYMKTQCYHVFHISCLCDSIDYFISVSTEKKQEMAAKSLNVSGRLNEEEIQDASICPFCRTKLGKEDIEEVNKFKSKTSHNKNKRHTVQEHFEIPREIKEVTEKMKELYNHQLQKGGIIDVQQNQKRFLVDSTCVLAATTSSQSLWNSQPLFESVPEESKRSLETPRHGEVIANYQQKKSNGKQKKNV